MRPLPIMKLNMKFVIWVAIRNRACTLKMPYDWTTLLQWPTIAWVMCACAMASVNRPWKTYRGQKSESGSLGAARDAEQSLS